jgi:hypothetical protein
MDILGVTMVLKVKYSGFLLLIILLNSCVSISEKKFQEISIDKKPLNNNLLFSVSKIIESPHVYGKVVIVDAIINSSFWLKDENQYNECQIKITNGTKCSGEQTIPLLVNNIKYLKKNIPNFFIKDTGRLTMSVYRIRLTGIFNPENFNCLGSGGKISGYENLSVCVNNESDDGGRVSLRGRFTLIEIISVEELPPSMWSS